MDLIEKLQRPLILTFYMLIVFPVDLAVSSPLGTAVELQFVAYRIQHFDIQSTQYGSRVCRVMYEAVVLGSSNILRRCLLVVWRDLLKQELSKILSKDIAAALIIIPADISSLSDQDKNNFQEMEQQLVTQSFDVPIFVVFDSAPMREMVAMLKMTQRFEQGSAFQALLYAIAANSFQVTSKCQDSNIKIDQPLFNVIAKLSSYERAVDVNTIAIVAHYDSFGLAPALSFGADSNGSGVAVLLELLRILHKFYQTPRTRPKYNVVFLLSAGGKFNYQGSRHWIEEYLEQTQSAVGRLEMAICLDSLGGGRSLRMHVSKLPAENSAPSGLLKQLEVSLGSNQSLHVIAKKINLAADLLAWEHERFAIRRLPAVTLSHLKNHRHFSTRSISDTRRQIHMDSLNANVEVIAEALLRYLYKLPHQEDNAAESLSHTTDTFLNSWVGVKKERLQGWLDFLTSKSRAAQVTILNGAKDNLLASLLQTFDHYAHEAYLSPVSIDKKDPEFVLYGATNDVLVAYRVKPAVFDLVLAAFIALYIGIFYFTVQNVHTMLYSLQSFMKKVKTA